MYVNKSIFVKRFYFLSRKVGVPIIGVVENMSGFVCPKCTTKSMIFAPSSGGAEKMAGEMNVPFLGAVPIDPRIAKSCDLGEDLLEEFQDSPAVQSLRNIAERVVEFCSR